MLVGHCPPAPHEWASACSGAYRQSQGLGMGFSGLGHPTAGWHGLCWAAAILVMSSPNLGPREEGINIRDPTGFRSSKAQGKARVV